MLVFLFNVGGYYIVFWGIQNQARQDLLQRLDSNRYATNEVVVLSIPITLPYPVHQRNYERVDGDFVYKGEYLKLVKQKLVNDTLFLVCIKDAQAKKLAIAMTDYSKLANDVPADSKQAFNFLGKLFKDFTTTAVGPLAEPTRWFEYIFYTENIFTLLHKSYPVDSPPPELIS